MARKKKYLLIFLFTLFVALFGFSLETSCLAVTNSDPHLSSGEMAIILNSLNFTSITGDTTKLVNITNTFNTAITYFLNTYSDLRIENLLFIRNQYSGAFQVGFFNNTVGNTFDYAYISSTNTNTSVLANNFTDVYIRNFNSWTYDSNNNINGVNTSKPIGFYINSSNLTTYTVFSSSNFETTGNGYFSGDTIYIPRVVCAYKFAPVYARNNDYGNKSYFLANTVDLGRPSNIPTPTPTPSAEPTTIPTGGGSGGTTDLTETNNKIDDVNQNLEIIEQKIPDSGEIATIIDNGTNSINNTLTGDVDLDNISVSSGDIIDALGFTLMEDPYSNFWYTLTQNLNASLTSSVRTFTFESPFDDSTITIDLDDYPVNLPETIQWLITTITVYFLVMIIMRYFHDIYVLITSGNVDEVLAMNEESGIVDLF